MNNLTIPLFAKESEIDSFTVIIIYPSFHSPYYLVVERAAHEFIKEGLEAYWSEKTPGLKFDKSYLKLFIRRNISKKQHDFIFSWINNYAESFKITY